MKFKNQAFLLTLLFITFTCFDLTAQNLVITDTIKVTAKPLTDSSFFVQGEVMDFDSGSIKLTWDKSIIYVPVRQGYFHFSGHIKTAQKVRFEVVSDYYIMGFYVEPGQIVVQTGYKEKNYKNQFRFKAFGTRENDLENYFNDSLNKENTFLFGKLGRSIQEATESQDLVRYRTLIDSFKIAERTHFDILSSAIRQKQYGLYLLSSINSYNVRYGHFAKRRALWKQLPEDIRNSASGLNALALIERDEIKSERHKNLPAYPFHLINTTGKTFSLNQYKGKVIVVDFWASWCVPCIKSLPMLKKVQKSKLGEDVIFISVSVDKNSEAWRVKEKELAIPWLSLLADETTILKYEVNPIPDYVVINKDGKMISRGSSIATLINTLQNVEK